MTRPVLLMPSTAPQKAGRHTAARQHRLATLNARYREDAATMPSDWLDYGEHDPLECDRWVNPCIGCGAQPAPVATGTLVVVRCTCGAEALGAKMRWQAVMNWNKSPLAKHPHWRDLPFFFLSDLDIAAARHKLARLRTHLELRANIAGTRRALGMSAGRDFIQRLKAYLAWCHYAQSLVVREIREQVCAKVSTRRPSPQSG